MLLCDWSFLLYGLSFPIMVMVRFVDGLKSLVVVYKYSLSIHNNTDKKSRCTPQISTFTHTNEWKGIHLTEH